jgi:hypothetical protein
VTTASGAVGPAVDVMPDPAPDLDSTDNCPLGTRCESCGVERPDLAVHVRRFNADSVYCLTLCPPCAGSSVDPPITVGTAVRLVAQHAGHVARVAVDPDRQR